MAVPLPFAGYERLHSLLATLRVPKGTSFGALHRRNAADTAVYSAALRKSAISRVLRRVLYLVSRLRLVTHVLAYRICF